MSDPPAILDQEIEEAKRKIAELRQLKKGLQHAAALKRQEVKETVRCAQLVQAVKMLDMASKGMSTSKIAAELGVSKYNMPDKIRWAWRIAFHDHFRESRDKIWDMGLLTALRDSPPDTSAYFEDKP